MPVSLKWETINLLSEIDRPANFYRGVVNSSTHIESKNESPENLTAILNCFTFAWIAIKLDSRPDGCR